MKYRKSRLPIYIGTVFVVFAILSAVAGLLNRESDKRAIIMSRLSGFAELAASADDVSEAASYIPAGVRLTIIGIDGSVVYDSDSTVTDFSNHLDRPEVRECLRKGEGSSIRRSGTDGRKYFYYAGMFDGKIVRAAQDFDVDIEKFYRTDWTFVLLIVILLLFSLIFVVILSERYGREEEEKADRETRRLKHQMTGNISHELKTPVSVIQGYLETIVNHPELDEQRRRIFIERSYLQAVRLSDTIADISTVTKIEEAPEQFKLSPVNLKVVFEEVYEEMSDCMPGKILAVENELPPLCVRGNYQLIYAIFRNLVENTMKYAGDGASVKVSYSGAGHVHTIDYSDTGNGVPESELDKIFERFYRLDSDRSKPVGGSGLGLSIVRNAVHFHKGDIRAYCVPGGGLGFRFTLVDLK